MVGRPGYHGVMSRRSEAPPFVHLHLHTHYSLLDAAIRIPDLAAQVSRLEMSAVAVTDHGNVFGAFQFHKAAINAGIRPVIGCEVYVSPGDHRERTPVPGRRRPYDHLVLLAENNRGYSNLVKLVSAGLSGRLLSQAAGFEGAPRRPQRWRDCSLVVSVRRGVEAPAGRGTRNGRVRRPRPTGRYSAKTISSSRSRTTEWRTRSSFVRGWSSCRKGTGIPLVATNDCHFHEARGHLRAPCAHWDRAQPGPRGPAAKLRI